MRYMNVHSFKIWFKKSGNIGKPNFSNYLMLNRYMPVNATVMRKLDFND